MRRLAMFAGLVVRATAVVEQNDASTRAQKAMPRGALRATLVADAAAAAAVLDVKLNNGKRFPLVGLGVGNMQHERITQSIDVAVRHHGVRTVDTAMGSRNAHLVRDAAARTGERVHVITKVWYTHLGYERTTLAVNEALAELEGCGCDVTVLIHWPRCRSDISWMRCDEEEDELPERYKEAGPPPSLDAYLGSWKALEEFYREGRVAHIGVSNFDRADTEKLFAECDVDPQIFQGNAWILWFDKALVAALRARRVLIQAYNVENGIIKRQTAAPRAYAALERIARQRGRDVDVSTVALRAFSQADVATIPRAANPAHLAANAPAAVATLLPLTSDELELANAAMAALMSGRDLPEEGVVATFTSTLDEVVKIFWRSDSGELVPNGDVTRDEGRRINTHPGHRFEAYAGDKFVKSFFVSAEGSQAFEL